MMARFFHVLVIAAAVLCICVPSALAEGGSDPTLQAQKLQAEISKLQAEVEDLKSWARPWIAFFGAVGGLGGAILGIVAIWLGNKLGRRMDVAQVQKLKQERELDREKHNLELFLALAKNPREQIAAASVLLQRLRESCDGDGADIAKSKKNQRERFTISQVLVSTIKIRGTDPNVCKMIGDNLVRSIEAIVPAGKEPSGKYSPLLGTGSPDVEPKIDFQGVHLTGVWWERVDARAIDFFETHLDRAGLAEAFLCQAVFYRANLSGSVLRHADLRGANLVQANLRNCNLQGAKLQGANLKSANLRGCRLEDAQFDEKTIWPDRFKPVDAGAVVVA